MEFIGKDVPRPLNLVQCLNYSHRQTNRPAGVGNGALNALTDPPGRVSREPESALVLEPIDGDHQTDIAFLYEIEQWESPVGETLRNGHHESKVRGKQLLFRGTDRAVALEGLSEQSAEPRSRNPDPALQVEQMPQIP